MMIYDVIGSVFIGVSIVCFAVAADFAPGGVNGIAVMANYLAKGHIENELISIFFFRTKSY